MKSKMLFVTLLALMAILVCPASATKNVFVMISDGASFGAWDMGDLYEYGSTVSSPYYGPEWVKFLMTTYPLNMSTTPTYDMTPQVGYNPHQAWGLAAYAYGSASYLHQNAVDSAASGTAMSTGQKTYNNAINWSNMNEPITPTLPELAKQYGKKVGTISSVQWSHATPAAFSDAHDVSRNNYAAIAQDMLNGTVMDVIMGAGHPLYTNNGTLASTPYYSYVGGQTEWTALINGTHPGGWKAIDSKADFQALANGDLSVLGGKTRLVGTAQVATTLQQSRSGYSHTDTVYSDPFNTNVPTLETMTLAALNVLKALDTNNNGIFLQIEGGAVDWAAHSNQTSRIIEEQLDFNKAVKAVINWIETVGGGWSNNLLIITTDHGNSMPMGESSNTIPHERIALQNIQAGTYTSSNPNGVRWWSGNHTNELVPLFARGCGASLFAQLVDGTDPYFAQYYADWAAKGFTGQYIDTTDIYTAAASCIVPEPATVALLGLGAAALFGRRK